MVLPRFEVIVPSSLREALDVLEKYGREARLLAGGTELLVLLRDRRIPVPKYIVSLRKLRKELSYVKEENGWIRIGALTSIWDLNQSILGKDLRYAGFTDVFHKFGTISIRFMATIGGNIASSTPYSDYLTLLLVYDARVRLISTSGERIVALEDFVLDKRELDIKPGELIAEILFKKPRSSCSSSFIKFDRRELMIAGVVTSAAFMCLDENNVITDVKISFDMVKAKHIPGRARRTEAFLLNREFSEEALNEAIEKVLPSEMERRSDWWTTAEYRLEMSKVVLKRNLLRIYERLKRRTP